MVKTRLLIVSILTVCLVWPSWGVAETTGPQWTPYAKGLETAKALGKDVLIHFFSENCKYCHMMEQQTYRDKDVAAFMTQNFVTVKVNSDLARDLSAAFMVRALPTIWFLDSEGKKIAPLPGFVPAEPFLLVLKFVQSKSYQNMTFSEYVEKQGQNP